MVAAQFGDQRRRCVWQGAALGQKCFRNFGGTRGAGPKTMRWGIEQSRNLMTIRLAQEVGMSTVAAYAERFGVYDRLGQPGVWGQRPRLDICHGRRPFP